MDGVGSTRFCPLQIVIMIGHRNLNESLYTDYLRRWGPVTPKLGMVSTGRPLMFCMILFRSAEIYPVVKPPSYYCWLWTYGWFTTETRRQDGLAATTSFVARGAASNFRVR